MLHIMVITRVRTRAHLARLYKFLLSVSQLGSRFVTLTRSVLATWSVALITVPSQPQGLPPSLTAV